jgi:hypothetical protein
MAPDLMNRDFAANKPDEKYVGDITTSGLGGLSLPGHHPQRLLSPHCGWRLGTTLHLGLVVAVFEMVVHQRQA